MAVQREGEFRSSARRKLPEDKSLCVRGADPYKYSREGRDPAPVSLVSFGNPAPCNGGEMDGVIKQSFRWGFLMI